MPDANDQFLPFDLQQQSQQAQRQRAIADALQQRSLQAPQGQMVSGHYVSPGIGGALGQIAQALISRYSGQQADAQMAGIGQQYQDRTKAETGSFFDKYLGNPSPVMNDQQAGALMNNDQASDLTPQPADPKAAITQAMMSSMPQVQRLGQSLLPDFLESRKPKTVTVKKDETVFDLRRGPDGAPVTQEIAKGPSEQYGPIQTIPGADGKTPLQVQQNLLTKKWAVVDPGVKITNVNDLGKGDKYGNKLDEQLAEGTIGRLKSGYEAAKTAQAAQAGLEEAQKALDAGIFSGAGADWKEKAAKVIQALGGTIDPTAANSEVFRSQMGAQLFSIIKNFGTGNSVTNQDVKNAEGIVGRDTGLDERGLRKLLSIAQAGAFNSIHDHQRYVEQAIQADPETSAKIQLSYGLSKDKNNYGYADNIDFDPKLGRFVSTLPLESSGLSKQVQGGQAAPAAERTAVNPTTGETIVLRNGQWVKK